MKKINLYKTIIPDLVSIETNLKQIRYFHLCQNLNFFPSSKRKQKFHYKAQLVKDINIPRSYDYKSDYFIKKDNCWYFERKIFIWNFKFKYDTQKKSFFFNKIYYLLPFRIGRMSIIGEHMTDLITLDLFLSGIISIRGMAIKYKNKYLCFSAPGFNGKTTMLIDFLLKGAKYIGEDILIIDIKDSHIFPTCPFIKYNFWENRQIDKRLSSLVENKVNLTEKNIVDNFYLYQNSLTKKKNFIHRNIVDYLFLNSLDFINTIFIRSYIVEEGLREKVFKQIETIKKLRLHSKYIHINDFKFPSIL